MPEIADERVELPTTASRTLFEGRIVSMVSETVDLGPGGTVTREFVRHPGAVAVVALDDTDRLLMIRQYRHPVRSYLWEIPAGLLDVPGEPLVEAAQRELAEEADLSAGRWDTLVDIYASPGGLDEALRIFLARDLAEVPAAHRHERTEEELGMRSEWVPLDEAVQHVLAGNIHNPAAAVGILAAHAARAADWAPLRPASAPWVR